MLTCMLWCVVGLTVASPCGWLSPQTPVRTAACSDAPIADLRARKAEANVLVLLTANVDHERLLANQLLNLRRLGVRNVAVACLDAELGPRLAAHGLRCDLSQRDGNASGLHLHEWARMHVIGRFLACGVDVVVADNDAVWARSPLAVLHEIDTDLVASRGNMPGAVAAEWGAAVNVGFLFLRANAATSALWTAVLQSGVVSTACNLQTQLNRALLWWSSATPGVRIGHDRRSRNGTGRAWFKLERDGDALVSGRDRFVRAELCCAGDSRAPSSCVWRGDGSPPAQPGAQTCGEIRCGPDATLPLFSSTQIDFLALPHARHPLRIALLPQAMVRRHCEDSNQCRARKGGRTDDPCLPDATLNESYVVHCDFKSNATSRARHYAEGKEAAVLAAVKHRRPDLWLLGG